MSELQLIENTLTLNTVKSIESDLRMLGLSKGMTVIVHSSLKSIGWVSGGENAVVQALMNIITNEGNIVMPTQSGDLSDPIYWQNPPIPESWIEEVKATMPAFNPKTTHTRGMGRIVDNFRTQSGVFRSYHPTSSFAAWGKDSIEIVGTQPLEAEFGLDSPLQKIYDLNGYVLLIGVDHSNNTSLHLSEHIVGNRAIFSNGAPIIKNGIRVWKEYEKYDYDSEEFNKIGNNFEQEFQIRQGFVGNAFCKLMKQTELVDFGVKWFRENDED